MSPLVVMRIRSSHLIAAIFLVLLSFYLYRFILDRYDRQAAAALSSSAAGRVIVVDPGHGGTDPGFAGRSGALEKDITLAVAKLLAVNLGQAGSMVLMTREADYDLSDPGTLGAAARKKEDLKKRVDLANSSRADLYVGIHVNSFPDGSRRGAQSFVQAGSSESLKAGCCIQGELARVLKNTDRAPREVDHYITRNTRMPAVIVEIGFITNEAEEKLLQDPAYQGKTAWAVYTGIVKYLAQRGFSEDITEKESIIKTFKEQSPVFLKEP